MLMLTMLSQVLDLIEDQTAKIDQPVHALLLVGGFSGTRFSPATSLPH